MTTQSEKKKKPLLSDHQRRGKKLVPPLMQIGTMHLTSWVDTGLPESLWNAALQDLLGRQRGVDIGLNLCKLAASVSQRGVFRLASDFARLRPEEVFAIREGLGETRRAELMVGLAAFCRLYPECPLRSLVGLSPDVPYTEEDVLWAKSLVSRVFDKTSVEATHALASLVYVTFAQGALFVAPGLMLSRFPEIEPYPETEDSRLIASAVRSVVNTFFGPEHYDANAAWPKYFWFRSFALEPCYFEEEVNGRE